MSRPKTKTQSAIASRKARRKAAARAARPNLPQTQDAPKTVTRCRLPHTKRADRDKQNPNRPGAKRRRAKMAPVAKLKKAA
jgi:hypothetical protein